MRISKLLGISALMFAALASLHVTAVVANLQSAKLDMLITVAYAKDAPTGITWNPVIARVYLHMFRGTTEDIRHLETNSAGAAFVTNMTDLSYTEKAELLDFLISKGLDLNRANIRGEVPLSGPVLLGSVGDTKLLLERGARTDISVLSHGRVGSMTAIELAHFLQNHPARNKDFSAVISLLENTKA